MPAKSPLTSEADFIYAWRLVQTHPERKGMRCRKHELGRGQIEVEFEDGFRCKATRVAIKLAPLRR